MLHTTLLALAAVALVPGATAAVNTLPGASPLVNWAGRVTHDAAPADSVTFDWVGVSARVAVKGATYVRVNVTSTSADRGTRLRAYAESEGALAKLLRLFRFVFYVPVCVCHRMLPVTLVNARRISAVPYSASLG